MKTVFGLAGSFNKNSESLEREKRETGRICRVVSTKAWQIKEHVNVRKSRLSVKYTFLFAV
ncbi:hypothetical protein J6590_084759 [Homalodisca vitripennis]|nr:hypothetical protein J6590_084759 [Homalodisca vitripennis]